jgi:chemotaxis protein methyltransferase CheR
MLKDPFEHAALTSLFSVTVTEFFRDREFFELLKARLLPSLARSNRVKIWCAGCATGEEPYSIAILAQESLQDSSGRVKIFATDINPDSIRFAKEGMYEEKSLKNVPEDLKAKYFRRAGKDFWQVGQEILDAVDFEAGDLDRMAPPAKELDMILCRNVMIYFDRASRESLLKKFHDALKPQGYFVMGQSEIMTGKAFSLFKSAWPRERVYQKS